MRTPEIEWPTSLAEMGPDGDPSILLAGKVIIAGTDYVITAIRMRQDLADPDYRDDIEQDAYEAVLGEMLDDMDFLVSARGTRLLPLDGGHYLLWMIPADR
jgi:hypothetical protein